MRTGGRADLVFDSSEGLVVVDYKTVRIADAELSERVMLYQGQARAYALGLASSTDRAIHEVVLIFARNRMEHVLQDGVFRHRAYSTDVKV